MPLSLRNTPFVRMLAESQKSLDNLNARFPGVARGTVRATVKDVEDPQNRGRVRVLFDAHNPKDIPQFEGAGEYSAPRYGEEYLSHWIDTSPAFKGRQPPGLVGKRVNVVLSNGQYQYAVLQDVIYDPEVLTESSSKTLEVPNNSPMVRLPIYPAGQLPLPSRENLGCTVIEEGGPMNSDWVCVCLGRNGKYIWVRHSDLAHAHAGGNDVTSQVDSQGNRPSPGQMGLVWDHVIPTSSGEIKKYTGYSSAPSGNPWGVDAAWSSPPMSPEIEPRPFSVGPLFSQGEALQVARNSGFLPDIQGGFLTEYEPGIPSAVEMVPGYNFVDKALKTAQRALEIANSLKKIIEKPSELVSNTAKAALGTSVPESTKFTTSSLTNISGTINTVYSNLKQALSK